MANDPNSILAITQPKLDIRKLTQLDIDSIDPESKLERYSGASVQSTTGFDAPYIEIDNYIVQPGKIISLTINQVDFLPELTLSFIDDSGSFSGMYFPRTNPILKLYIKSLSPSVKPIRSDYLINNVTCSEIGNLYSARQKIELVYTVTAKLYIPGIYGNTTQSIPNKKSWEALKQIADSLYLGFATNETSTNDAMTWINPNGTTENFIKNICKRAYKDDKSFFDCFIDVNYILHFVNYEKALAKETKVINIPIDATGSQHSEKFGNNTAASKDDKPKEERIIPVLLTSSIKKSNTGMQIASYSMHSNHGEILAGQSFRKRLMWHDRKFYLENKEEIEHFIEPINQKTLEYDKAVYQKPKLENFNKETTLRWVGIDYNNGHQNYKFSRILNTHNLDEFSKNYLVVKIPGATQGIYRGAKIEVLIKRLLGDDKTAYTADYQYSQDARVMAGTEEYVDVYLTGQYVVKDINYEFNGASSTPELRYSTELTLVRREWIELGDGNKLDSERLRQNNVQ